MNTLILIIVIIINLIFVAIIFYIYDKYITMSIIFRGVLESIKTHHPEIYKEDKAFFDFWLKRCKYS